MWINAFFVGLQKYKKWGRIMPENLINTQYIVAILITEGFIVKWRLKHVNIYIYHLGKVLWEFREG